MNIISGTFAFLWAFILFIFRGHFLRKEKGARFSTGSEKRKIFQSQNTGVLIDGKDRRLSDKDSFEHLAIIAKPGGGKTSAYIVPNILYRASQKSSMIVLDPSGDIFKNTSGHLSRKGYRIKVLNPDEPEFSSKFNPFNGLDARDLVEIEQVCASIVLSRYSGDKEGIWNDGAISLIEIFAKCLAYSAPEKLNLPNINYLLQLFGSDGKQVQQWVIDHSLNPFNKDDSTIIDSWIGITKSNEKMLASYSTIARTALKQVSNPQLQSVLCEDSLELDSFRKKKTILYVIIPAHQQAYYQFVIDILYTRFFNIMMKALPRSSDLDVYCFLDEFGSSYIKDFQALINNARRYRISISIVLQTISQLYDKYQRSADSIKGGIGSYVVYAGADHNTALHISEAIGKQQIEERNHFADVSKNWREYNLLNPDQIRTLRDNEIVFLSKNRFPFILNITPFFKNRRFDKLTYFPEAKLSEESTTVINTIDVETS